MQQKTNGCMVYHMRSDALQHAKKKGYSGIDKGPRSHSDNNPCALTRPSVPKASLLAWYSNSPDFAMCASVYPFRSSSSVSSLASIKSIIKLPEGNATGGARGLSLPGKTTSIIDAAVTTPSSLRCDE